MFCLTDSFFDLFACFCFCVCVIFMIVESLTPPPFPQFKVCPQSLCVSTPGHRTDLFRRDPGSVLITDFFGSVRKVEITREVVNLSVPIEDASTVM